MAVIPSERRPRGRGVAGILARPALFCLISALAACGEETAPPSPTPAREQIVAGHCEQREFEGSAFTACRYDRREHDIALFVEDQAGPLRSFDRLEAHLGERAADLLFAMNAGMYDEAGRPIGLYVADAVEGHAINRREGPGNFHMKPNGVFAVADDGTPSIVDSEDWAGSARWATQSGPLLLSDGAIHPRIQPNGPSLHIRNGVGVDDAHIAWFAVSEEPVSFGRFARFFRDSLGCDDALFLDGAVSSLWDPAAQRQDAYDSLGPMVAVFRRSGQ
ncbi:phosphodiester glycosidase family protein [Sphingosinicella terrae]|uniref:phosphodiester glycosidase family protein n=1 Tax=Sphingosinicella terrae TaxID=2172047 RepID=UPI000E0DB73F|nr:phosphodiester glycosidase family protein [Sphingosinicella terrae]